MSVLKNATKKPGQLKAIFILNALLVLIGFTFYFVISSRVNSGQSTLGIPPSTLLTMALIYTSVFAIVVASIIMKNLWILRGALLATILCSIIIIFAPIGIVLAGVSLGLSFAKPVKQYFD